MTYLLFNIPSSTPISLSLRVSSSSSKPRKPFSASPPIPKTIPARDMVIDFGKHKGKMLGTLPSNYLRWVSKSLRARDFEQWANLADQVLQDPVYQDRIEWEFADNVLHGNNAKVTAANYDSSAVSMLLEMSERFGWDNEDKAGWSRVNFELLGTSKGGRIPRILDNENGDNGGREDKKKAKGGDEDGVLGEKRMERRERVRLKREEEEKKKKKNWGSFRDDGGVRLKSQGFDKKDHKVEIYNPFPGRQALLNKALQRRKI